jgi:phytoene synthase
MSSIITAGTPAPLHARDYENGYEECYEILREHGKTFYVMAKLLGPTRGKAIAAIYGFARTSDDTVDVPDADKRPDEIQQELDDMKVELIRAVSGVSRCPRYAVLGETVRKYSIEIYPFDDLLKGVAMDLKKVRYESFEELELYCYRVAGTIGLMITPVAGYEKNSQALFFAKRLGTAFQLTNILRDIGDDLNRGRIYLPKDELKRFGLDENDLIRSCNDNRFKRFMDFQIDRAFSIYREGLQLIPLVKTIGGRIAFQFAVEAYSSILHKIRENDYDVYSKRAHLTFWEKIKMIPGCIVRGVFSGRIKNTSMLGER